MDDMKRLEVEVVEISLDLAASAFIWADRLHQSRAYDGFYLALAEQAGVPLVTADKRLFNAGRELGIDWLFWAGTIP